MKGLKTDGKDGKVKGRESTKRCYYWMYREQMHLINMNAHWLQLCVPIQYEYERAVDAMKNGFTIHNGKLNL